MDCVWYYMTGTPESSTENGFMEEPGIEPAIPGLQDIGYFAALSLIYAVHFFRQTSQRWSL